MAPQYIPQFVYNLFLFKEFLLDTCQCGVLLWVGFFFSVSGFILFKIFNFIFFLNADQCEVFVFFLLQQVSCTTSLCDASRGTRAAGANTQISESSGCAGARVGVRTNLLQRYEPRYRTFWFLPQILPNILHYVQGFPPVVCRFERCARCLLDLVHLIFLLFCWQLCVFLNTFFRVTWGVTFYPMVFSSNLMGSFSAYFFPGCRQRRTERGRGGAVESGRAHGFCAHTRSRHHLPRSPSHPCNFCASMAHVHGSHRCVGITNILDRPNFLIGFPPQKVRISSKFMEGDLSAL